MGSTLLSGFAAAELLRPNYILCDAIAIAFNNNIERYGYDTFMLYLRDSLKK